MGRLTMGLFALLILSHTVVAEAAVWKKSQINDVINRAKRIDGRLNDKVKAVANRIDGQLGDLDRHGFLIKESVEDVLEWLVQRQGDYEIFIGGPRGSCGSGSPCSIFRSELETLFVEFGDLGAKFPPIERWGFGAGDAPRITARIQQSPPIVLFWLDEAMKHLDDWRDLPADLSSIYDEVSGGDPDVFSVELDPDPEESGGAWGSGVRQNRARPATERFCNFDDDDPSNDRLSTKVDPIRLNRIQLVLSYLTKIYDIAAEAATDDIEAEIAGEGSDITNPLHLFSTVVKDVFEFVQDAIETHRANVAVCQELEQQVASCLFLVEFLENENGRHITDFVNSRILDAEQQVDPAPTVVARDLWNQAIAKQAIGQWREAYDLNCQAYQAIGETEAAESRFRR